MPIVKISPKKTDYASIDNRVLNDERLSWKARGILAYLLSKPASWKVWLKNLENSAPDGMHAVRSGIKELIDVGYIDRSQEKNEDGTFGEIIYIVNEVPHSGFPHADNPHADNHMHIKKDTTNTDITNKDRDKAAARPKTSPYSEGLKYCLRQFSRKRFSTNGQRETLEALEKEVGTEIFKRAVDWKANLGGLDANAIVTCAHKMAKQQRLDQAHNKRAQQSSMAFEKRVESKPRTFWDDILDDLRSRLPPDAFQTMFVGTVAQHTDDGIIVYAKNERHREWMANRLARIVISTVHASHPDANVVFATKGDQ